MAVNVRSVGGLTVLSNFGRLMNDPRYVDAARDVRELLDRGDRKFVMELAGVNETGSSLLGVLTTLTRTIRAQGGEVVIVRPSPQVGKYIEEMQMDDYWDVFRTLDEAERFYED